MSDGHPQQPYPQQPYPQQPYPQQPYPQQPYPQQPARSAQALPGLWLSLAAIALLAVGLSVKEDGSNAWETIGVWGGFALAAAAATLAPVVATPFKLTPTRAWQIAAGGAASLAAFWVLLVLPSISQNVSFLATAGCAAGVWAAWLSPGRARRPEGGQSW